MDYNGLGNEWQSLESAFEKEFLAATKTDFTSSDLIAQLLEYDITDEDFAAPFVSLIDSDATSETEEQNVDMNVGYSEKTLSTNSSVSNQIHDKAADINQNYLLASGGKKISKSDIVDTKETSNDGIISSLNARSPVKPCEKSKISKKKLKRKHDAITRSVTTETIFNGSIADIVKTRKRRSRADFKECDATEAEIVSDYETSDSKPVDNNRAFFPPAKNDDEDDDYSVPKIKLCIRLKKEEIVKEEKSRNQVEKGKQENNSLPATMKAGKAGSEKEVNKKLKKQMKKQKKSNVKLNAAEVMEIDQPLGSQNVESGLESNISSPCNSLSSPPTDIDAKASPSSFPMSEDNTTVDDHLSKDSGSDHKFEEGQTKINKSDSVNPPAKKKLRGIEEYKALRAKIKPAGKTSPHINNLVLDDTPLAVPELNHDAVIHQLQKHLDSKKAASIDVMDLPVLKYDKSSDIKTNVCNLNSIKSKGSVDSKVPNDLLASKPAVFSRQIMSKVIEQTDPNVFPSVKPHISCITDVRIKTEPVEICAKMENSPIDQSTSRIPVNPSISNASRNIPAKANSEKHTSVIGPYQNLHSTTCDNKTKVQDNLSVPLSDTASCASLNTKSDGLGTSKSVQNVNKAVSNVTMSVLPFSSCAPDDKQPKRQYRRRYSSSSSDSDSGSDSSYRSNSSSRRKSSKSLHSRQSSALSRREKRFRSRARKNATNSRYSNVNKSPPSMYKTRRSSSRSRSYSRHSSSSLSDCIYEAYGLSARRTYRPSTSPVRTERSQYRSKYQRSSPSGSTYTSRHSSKSPERHASKERSRYSPLPPRRRCRRNARRRSSSSTADSKCRGGSSSSSRSRSRERTHRYYQSSRNSSRQQPNRWEEQQRPIDERRVVYVGVIPDDYTQTELRDRFSCFGSIEDVRIHMRKSRRNDNYGFVTFRDKQDAYRAVERGNDHPLEPKFGISFGGRRRFCKQQYSDLDKENEMSDDSELPLKDQKDLSFDNLLKAELQRIKVKGKKC